MKDFTIFIYAYRKQDLRYVWGSAGKSMGGRMPALFFREVCREVIKLHQK